MKRVYNLNIDRIPEANLLYHRKVRNLKPKPNPNLDPSPDLPSFVDLRTNINMPPVYDQGAIGSCVANVLCAAYEFDNPGFIGSRLFLYYNGRKITNNVSTDSGTTITAGVQSLDNDGLCSETEWPYETYKCLVRPYESCYISALENTATRSTNVPTTLEGMQTILASGIPFAIGIRIYSSFESSAVAKTGIIPMPKNNERLLGGHAILVCGYDNNNKWWIVRNSWGSSWGDKGYFYLPYQYLTTKSFSSDAWCLEIVSLRKHIYNLKLQPMPEDPSLYKSMSFINNAPPVIDFRKLYPSKMEIVYNQGKLGSCTANALCSAFSFISPSNYLGSRLFLYYNERLNQGDKVESNGSITIDSGSTIINGVQCLQKYGLCSESLLPYTINNYIVKPSDTSYATALGYKCTKYSGVLPTLSTLQGFLMNGKPFVLGFLVYSSFESRSSILTGYVPMPYISSKRKSDYLLGGHAVLVCGYDLTRSYPANPLNPKACPSGKGVWIIKNSWGTKFGDDGYFYLPLPYLTNNSLAIEFWSIMEVSA
uniref:Peptidase C1A papain C-terminal domain-containing protein n=1 Tax=viral metagenome TaxID=1070528 RepID=A0A6C0HEP4_9ZZZZ